MLTNPHGTNPLTGAIIGCAIRVHRAIGPGVFEAIYAECFACELHHSRLSFEAQRPVKLVYRHAELRTRYYIDFVVENRVVVELKAVEALARIHHAQLLTQLKLSGLPVGLLINFNVPLLVDGVERVVNPLLKGLESANI